MNNKHFIERCATIVSQANLQKLSSFTVKDLFVLCDMSTEHAAYQVMKRMCESNILVQTDRSNYALSDSILKYTSSLFKLSSGAFTIPEEDVLKQAISKFLDIQQESSKITEESAVVHKGKDKLEKIVKALTFARNNLQELIEELQSSQEEQTARLCSELERVRSDLRKAEIENKKLRATNESMKQRLIDSINAL